MIFNGCDIVTVEIVSPPLPVHQKDEKPDTPVPLGCIRGYFGDYYKTFTDNIENVQPVDSFSNIYFYGSCNNALKQINLRRRNSDFVLAIYIMGYSLDTLPASLPVTSEYGKFSEIQYYKSQDWNSTSPGHYSLDNFYGNSVFITDISDDIVTGTFGGILKSPAGESVRVTEGEFKLKLFRKYLPCAQGNGK
jgi:hypothetical protein